MPHENQKHQNKRFTNIHKRIKNIVKTNSNPNPIQFAIHRIHFLKSPEIEYNKIY